MQCGPATLQPFTEDIRARLCLPARQLVGALHCRPLHLHRWLLTNGMSSLPKKSGKGSSSFLAPNNTEGEYRTWSDTWHSLCPCEETAGLRQDSGLQYVGNVQELQQSSGFKPMYPYQYNRELSSMSMRPNWRTHSITGRYLLFR